MSVKKPTDIPFHGTKEQESQLKAVMEKYKGTDGFLMPVLQQAQDIYGYLPYEVQLMISEEMDVPLAEIYGVATFYTQFNLSPKGKYEIGVCMGTACYVKNSGGVLDRLKLELGIDDGGCTPDGVFSLDATRCLGCCGLAPVMMINDDVFGRLVPDDIPGILAKYREQA